MNESDKEIVNTEEEVNSSEETVTEETLTEEVVAQEAPAEEVVAAVSYTHLTLPTTPYV